MPPTPPAEPHAADPGSPLARERRGLRAAAPLAAPAGVALVRGSRRAERAEFPRARGPGLHRLAAGVLARQHRRHHGRHRSARSRRRARAPREARAARDESRLRPALDPPRAACARGARAGRPQPRRPVPRPPPRRHSVRPRERQRPRQGCADGLRARIGGFRAPRRLHAERRRGSAHRGGSRAPRATTAGSTRTGARRTTTGRSPTRSISFRT